MNLCELRDSIDCFLVDAILNHIPPDHINITLQLANYKRPSDLASISTDVLSLKMDWERKKCVVIPSASNILEIKEK